MYGIPTSMPPFVFGATSCTGCRRRRREAVEEEEEESVSVVLVLVLGRWGAKKKGEGGRAACFE